MRGFLNTFQVVETLPELLTMARKGSAARPCSSRCLCNSTLFSPIVIESAFTVEAPAKRASPSARICRKRCLSNGLVNVVGAPVRVVTFPSKVMAKLAMTFTGVSGLARIRLFDITLHVVNLACHFPQVKAIRWAIKEIDKTANNRPENSKTEAEQG